MSQRQLVIFRNSCDQRHNLYAHVNRNCDALQMSELTSSAIYEANLRANAIDEKRLKGEELLPEEVSFSTAQAIEDALTPLGFKFEYVSTFETRHWDEYRPAPTLLETRLLHEGFPSEFITTGGELRIPTTEADVFVVVREMKWRSEIKPNATSKNGVAGKGTFADLIEYLQAFEPMWEKGKES